VYLPKASRYLLISLHPTYSSARCVCVGVGVRLGCALKSGYYAGENNRAHLQAVIRDACCAYI
jgi:hypothetical protein